MSIEHLLGKIHQGDCLPFMRSLPDKCVDFVLTSPPYNRIRNDKYKFFCDKIKDYDIWLYNICQELCRISKITAFNIQATSYNRADVYNLIGDMSLKIQDIIIWNKSNPIPANGGRSIVNAYEFVLLLSDNKIKPNHYHTNSITSSVNNDMPEDHKAVMKYSVAEDIVFSFAPRGGIIFDPFMGCGTTGIAAVRFRHPWFGCEIKEEYIKYAIGKINSANFLF